MNYERITEGCFLSRPNRFVAEIELSGKVEICHVKNTGRCRELLIPGARVYVQAAANPLRKTRYDLISVYKADQLVNIDSHAPNVIFAEWIRTSGFLGLVTLLRPEVRYGASRLDYYVEADGRKAFVEVKGVTLEEAGVARFPDAPTERGIRHLEELCRAVREGYEALAVFIIQMQGITCFAPNERTHPAFAEALRHAMAQGVRVLALDCHVTPDSLTPGGRVPVDLAPPMDASHP